jgi:hypothetical protein
MEVLSTHGLLHKCREVAVHCMMSVQNVEWPVQWR